MAIKPLNANVVAVKEQPKDKTASGILLGESKETPDYAIVEAVGPDVKDVKKGDKIVYKQYSTTDIKFQDKEYIIVKSEDILGVIVNG